MTSFKDVILSSVIDVNPTEMVRKGEKKRKILLENIQPFTRKIQGFEHEEFKGGSKFRNGDTLFARITPTLENGKTAQVTILNDDEVAFGSTEFIVLRAKEGKTDKNYLFYLALSEGFRNMAINLMTGTSGRKRVEINGFMSSVIKIPDLEYQKSVGKKLSSIDDKIEHNAGLISDLEEYSQLLFHKWFVDFNFPDKNGLPYKDNGGEMVEVDGKMIPKGWKIVPINKLVKKHTESVNPQDEPTKVFNHFSIPVFDDTRLYGKEFGSSIESNKYTVPKNSILVSKLNPWFKRIVYPYMIDEAICSTEFVVWNPKKDEIREYLYVLANTNEFIKYCTRASFGTSNSHKRVNPEYMLKYDIPYHEKTIAYFNDIVKPMIQKVSTLIIENQILEETRDLLIKKLIK